MRVYGIIGGIGSGKSAVARFLQECGAVILDADKIGHEVLRLPEIKALVRDRWGDSLFDQRGEIVRSRLAAIVFDVSVRAKTDLRDLQDMVHPRIAERISQTLDIHTIRRTEVVILDAPLLLEANWNHLVSGLIFIDVPESTRWERVKSRGWSREEFEKRERFQWPLEKKRECAIHILTNSGDLEDLRRHVRTLWDSL